MVRITEQLEWLVEERSEDDKEIVGLRMMMR